jgi:hypothetical protein
VIFAAVYYKVLPEVIEGVIPGVSGDEVKMGDDVQVANLADGKAYACTIVACHDDKPYTTFDIKIDFNIKPEQIVP